MKRLLLIIQMLSTAYYCIAQYDSTRSYDFGLADSKELLFELSIAVPCILLGVIICWATMWSRPQAQNNPNDKLSSFGCFGGCLIIVGIIFLVPLLAYVELIAVSLLYVAFFLGLIIAIIYWLIK